MFVQVGKNLSDKPLSSASTFFKQKNLSDKPLSTDPAFFKPGFNYNEITLGDVAANKKYTTSSGDERTLLWEDSSTGNGEIFDVLLYEKFFAPLSLRDTQVADDFIQTADCCAALLTGLPPLSCASLVASGSCNSFIPLALVSSFHCVYLHCSSISISNNSRVLPIRHYSLNASMMSRS